MKQGTPVTILAVDDEPEILDIVSHMLAEYRVLSALSVIEAKEIFARESCSLVITDIRMPGASGEELIAHVRKHSPQTPVIIITGHGERDSGAAISVFSWISKPFRRAPFLQTVREALEWADAQRS